MKVKFSNHKLWKFFTAFLSVLCSIESFILLFITISDKCKIIAAIINICIIILVFFSLLIYANRITEKSFKIGTNKIKIKFGELMAVTDGLKVINFNEYFDTKVDEKVVSSNTLHGKILDKYKNEITEIDNEILNSSDCNENIISKNVSRVDGKTTQYDLGTCFRYKDFIGLAFSKFDKNNHAYLNLEDYFYCLAKGWEQINAMYNNANLYIPLMGRGLTRGKFITNLSAQQMLQIMIDVLRISNIKFSDDITITFLLKPELNKEISLFDIK